MATKTQVVKTQIFRNFYGLMIVSEVTGLYPQLQNTVMAFRVLYFSSPKIDNGSTSKLLLFLSIAGHPILRFFMVAVGWKILTKEGFLLQ